MTKSFVSDLVEGLTKKTTVDFFKSVNHLDQKTLLKYHTALNSYSLYLESEYSQTKEQTVADLTMYASDWKNPQTTRTVFVGKLADATYQQIITKHLQNFVNFLKQDNPCPNGKCRQCKFSGVLGGKQRKGIKGYITVVKAYLRFFGLLDIVSEKQLQTEVKLPANIEEEPFPLEREHIAEILKETTNFRRRTLYCILSCTGLRIEEACAIQPANIVFFDASGKECDSKQYDIVGIRTVPEYSKFKRQRTTFVSKEFEHDLLTLVKNTLDGKPLFVKNENPFKAKANEGQSFIQLRDRLAKKYPVFAEKYTTGVSKITIHSFRSFFVTQANKIDYGFGHALAGHKQYMARYNRLTQKEKTEYYKKTEKFLSIFSPTDEKSEKLEQELETIKTQQTQFMAQVQSQQLFYNETYKTQQKMISEQQEIIEDLQSQLEMMLYADPNFRKAIV